MSFAIYLYYLLRNAATDPESLWASPQVYNISTGVLVWYASSIVLGRLYCGMHSFTDVFFGTAIGIAIGLIQGVYGGKIDAFITSSGWSLPIALTLGFLLMVNQHPQPIDDCPCFEDAIAAVAVLVGVTLAHWHAAKVGLDAASGFYQTQTPGWEGVTWDDTLVWWSFAIIKMMVGTVVVLIWRLAAKKVLHFSLPPIFRFASLLFELPTRRFYTPATEYQHVPGEKGLHPIPSMMDLPSMLANAQSSEGDEVAATGTLPHAHLYSAEKGMKWRGTSGSPPDGGAKRVQFVTHDSEKQRLLGEDDVHEEDVKHYDADG